MVNEFTGETKEYSCSLRSLEKTDVDHYRGNPTLRKPKD